jgi:large subunit ribosomal protein L30
MSNQVKKTLKVKLVKSPSRTASGHRDTVLGLGLKRINQVRELEDTPAVRGMITKVAYLVKLED